MRVLVACEESGIVREAFRKRGHDAWSCDLHPTALPGQHYQGDVREVLYDKWDLLIAHPVCRYLCNSGVRWLHEREGRFELMRQACEFFILFDRATHIPKRAVENPIMHKYARETIGRAADQYVQPWMFGDPYSKATGLWLHGLARLMPQYKKTDYERIEQKSYLMPPSAEREKLRSRTYPGIADAFAEQWGG